jgi:hypothetical protein
VGIVATVTSETNGEPFLASVPSEPVAASLRTRFAAAGAEKTGDSVVGGAPYPVPLIGWSSLVHGFVPGSVDGIRPRRRPSNKPLVGGRQKGVGRSLGMVLDETDKVDRRPVFPQWPMTWMPIGKRL